MARLWLTDGFLDDMAATPEATETRVWEKLALVEQMPGVGSALVSPELRRRFGTRCLKLLVDPYEVIYRWQEDSDVVEVLALVHQRMVRGSAG